MAPTVSELAAVVYPDDLSHGDAADALVRAFCQSLQKAGWCVAGLVQQRLPAQDGGKPPLALADLRTGQVFPISQQLGTLSQSCSLDPSAIAQASGVLRQALADRVTLAVVNRFGQLEASGGGYVQEIAALADAGVPVLTVLASKHLDAWRLFTGGQGAELAPRLEALRHWCAQATGRQVPQT